MCQVAAVVLFAGYVGILAAWFYITGDEREATAVAIKFMEDYQVLHKERIEPICAGLMIFAVVSPFLSLARWLIRFLYNKWVNRTPAVSQEKKTE